MIVLTNTTYNKTELSLFTSRRDFRRWPVASQLVGSERDELVPFAELSVDRPGLQVQSVVSGPQSVEHGGPCHTVKIVASVDCIGQYYLIKTDKVFVHIAPGLPKVACGFSASINTVAAG